MLSCLACLPAAGLHAAPRPFEKTITFCASAVDMADAELHAVAAINWNAFFLGNVRTLLSQCFSAYGLTQRVFFTDQAPLQASYNFIDRGNVTASRICIGVGNLAVYPYSTLIAVMLHELGHYFSYRSVHWEAIQSNAQPKQIELLADFLAGAAFARMERRKLTVIERVAGQCGELNLPWFSTGARAAPAQRASNAIVLNPRKLVEAGKGKAQFEVLRPDGSIERLENYALIGTMPDEDPAEIKCITTHTRTLNFLAMVAAVSTWRTFGDRPDTESHGSPNERYDAFSSGYQSGRAKPSLEQSLRVGMAHLGISA